MMSRGLAAALVVAAALSIGAQLPPTVDTSKIGPQIGTSLPPISGVDQFGKPHTLSSAMGPKGLMLVFFRSADW